jgi:hypothetical protein
VKTGNWAKFKEIILQNPDLELDNPILSQIKNMILQTPEATLAEIAAELGKTPESLGYHIKEFLAKWEAQQSVTRGREEQEEEILEPAQPIQPQKRYPYQRLRVQVARTLDHAYSELISQLTEKTSWFNQTLTEIGFYSTLLAFQAARIPPGKIPEQIEKFRDAEEFTKYVKNQLASLMIAVQNSERLLELEDEKRDLEAENQLLESLLQTSLETVNKLSTLLKMAMALMTPEQLKQFLIVVAVTESIGQPQPQPQQDLQLEGEEQ